MPALQELASINYLAHFRTYYTINMQKVVENTKLHANMAQNNGILTHIQLKTKKLSHL